MAGFLVPYFCLSTQTFPFFADPVLDYCVEDEAEFNVTAFGLLVSLTHV